jgi:hypothetical protein
MNSTTADDPCGCDDLLYALLRNVQHCHFIVLFASRHVRDVLPPSRLVPIVNLRRPPLGHAWPAGLVGQRRKGGLPLHRSFQQLDSHATKHPSIYLQTASRLAGGARTMSPAEGSPAPAFTD